jgi:hypothetical protein
MYTYHNGTNNSNYVCYHPLATANRTGTKQLELKCLDVAGMALLNLGTGCTQVADWSAATAFTPSATAANLICVPEGAIN